MTHCDLGAAGPRAGLHRPAAGAARRRQPGRPAAARRPGPLPAGRLQRRHPRRRPRRRRDVGGAAHRRRGRPGSRCSASSCGCAPSAAAPAAAGPSAGCRWRATGAAPSRPPRCGCTSTGDRPAGAAAGELPRAVRRGRRRAHGAGPPPAPRSAGRRRRRSAPWPLRFTDFDVLGHMNNAAYWAAVEEELAPPPRPAGAAAGRAGVPQPPSSPATTCECGTRRRRGRACGLWLLRRRRHGVRVGSSLAAAVTMERRRHRRRRRGRGRAASPAVSAARRSSGWRRAPSACRCRSRSSSSCSSTPARSSRAAPSTGCCRAERAGRPALVAASGGNHGAAVAYVAQRPRASGRGLRAVGERTGQGGAHRGLRRRADASAAPSTTMRRPRPTPAPPKTGALLVHPYDHADVVAGQGTMARELDEPGARRRHGARGRRRWRAHRRRGVVVRRPGEDRERRAGSHPGDVRGPARRARPSRSRSAAWPPTRWGPSASARCRSPCAAPFVDDAVLVTDDAIRDAQRALWASVRLVAEPGGAAALAAVLSGAYVPRARRAGRRRGVRLQHGPEPGGPSAGRRSRGRRRASAAYVVEQLAVSAQCESAWPDQAEVLEVGVGLALGHRAPGPLGEQVLHQLAAPTPPGRSRPTPRAGAPGARRGAP